QLLLSAGKPARGLVGQPPEPDALQDGARAIGCRAFLASDAARERECLPYAFAGLMRPRAQEVLEHGELAELARDLKGPHQAAQRALVRNAGGNIGALEDDPAGIGLEQTADHVKQRALAGAVRTDDAGDRAGGRIEFDLVQHADGSEGFAHAGDAQHRSPCRLTSPPHRTNLSSSFRMVESIDTIAGFASRAGLGNLFGSILPQE